MILLISEDGVPYQTEEVTDVLVEAMKEGTFSVYTWDPLSKKFEEFALGGGGHWESVPIAPAPWG